MTKDKEEAAAKLWEGHNHDKIKSYTHWVDDPQTGGIVIPNKFSHYCEGSEPHVSLPNLGIW